MTGDEAARDEAARDEAARDEAARDAAAERDDEVARARAFLDRAGLASVIDVHTHFMPEKLLAAVWAYFDAGGPLLGRPWPIVYRQDEQARGGALGSLG